MSKCPQCRKADRELLTLWERIRDRLFRCFRQDIADLSQAKYTQGFSDGWVAGHKSKAADVQRTVREILES